MPREKRIFPYNNEPLSLCRYDCGRQIYFVKTAKGAAMPVDFETKEPHFAHCPSYLKERADKRNPTCEK